MTSISYMIKNIKDKEKEMYIQLCSAVHDLQYV